MTAVNTWLRKNRVLVIALTILIVLFLLATRGMSTQDWVITTLRGLSVGALTFLVAAGLSIILGLLDVLNFAHGEMFMIGAYLGWTAYVRPDTFIDVFTPIALLAAGLVLMPVWRGLLQRVSLPKRIGQIIPWLALVVGAVVLFFALPRYPISIWDYENFAQAPSTFALAMDQGTLTMPPAAAFEDGSPAVVLGGITLGGLLMGVALGGFAARSTRGGEASPGEQRRTLILSGILVILAVVIFLVNTPLSAFLFGLTTTWRFVVAVIMATAGGALLGALIESILIRPLYDRPIYQLMLTLGLSFIIVELVRSIWGRTEFFMPKPALFNGQGEGCPATSLGGWLQDQCSTILVLEGRVRTYNEIFIIVVGAVVLIGVWLLLQRSRLGMIIRAGVQDSDMVEALGINVRRIFTQVFALGAALAALGGVLAGPALGLSNDMGLRVLLSAFIALAIGGLTSFPGAAAGSILVGLLQQFIIKYGQIGITLPFLAEPFKPSPPLVPASTVLLMVIVLLVLPNGLFGRKE
ncbi:MAG: branched-chain amino acid ABC transporter permease [Anaerolineae bacterium]